MTLKKSERPSGRLYNEGRAVSIEIGFSRHAEGSVLIKIGGTEVLCTASVETRVPAFLRNQGKGWITAEYGMLPRSTHSRSAREAAKGKQSGRTQEIQRLIGRSLRACVDLQALGEVMITLDCDVLNADGGTRCASITGAWVALALALKKIKKDHALKEQVAAISCGITKAGSVLDLDYDEDSTAQADTNFVLTAKKEIIEIQGTAEESPFRYDQFLELFELAQKGVAELCEKQNEALKAFEKRS